MRQLGGGDLQLKVRSCVRKPTYSRKGMHRRWHVEKTAQRLPAITFLPTNIEKPIGSAKEVAHFVVVTLVLLDTSAPVVGEFSTVEQLEQFWEPVVPDCPGVVIHERRVPFVTALSCSQDEATSWERLVHLPEAQWPRPILKALESPSALQNGFDGTVGD